MLDTLSGDLFQKLKVFHYILQYGSIGKAAAVIHRSPSSVSRQIQQLEEELGITLLLRSTGGAVPTPEGRQLYTHTLELFHNLEALLTSVSASRKVERLSGVVRIIAAPVAVDCLLPRILAQAARLYPEIRLEVTASSGIRLAMKAISAHDYHFTLSAQDDFVVPMDFQPVLTTTTCLISPPGYPLPENLAEDPRLLESLPMVGMPESMALSRFVNKHCDALGIRLNVIHLAPALRFQVAMVRAGFGVALVDRDHLAATGESGIDILPMPVFPPRVFGLIQRHNAFQPPHVRAIMNLILSHSKEPIPVSV